MFRFTLMLSPTNSPFFPVRYARRHFNKLAFTSLHCSMSNYSFDRRDSDLINLRTNMIQINIRPKHLQFAITNQIWWDLPRTVNETYLVWLMFQVLSNQHYPHRTNQTLRSWANAVFQNRGVCGQVFPPLLSPSPVISFFFFFCSRPNVLDGNACYAG